MFSTYLSSGILELAVAKDGVYYPSCFVDGHLLMIEELYDQRQVHEIADDLQKQDRKSVV